MGRRRVQRLNEQLKREITEIVRRDVKDPRVGNVVITGVDAAPDLSFARVHVQVPERENEAECLTGLQAARPFIRSLIGERLRVRRVPELRFEPDHSLDHARRIEELLAEAATGEDRDDDT